MTLQTRLNLGILGIAIVLVAPLVISLQSLQKLQEDHDWEWSCGPGSGEARTRTATRRAVLVFGMARGHGPAVPGEENSPPGRGSKARSWNADKSRVGPGASGAAALSIPAGQTIPRPAGDQ